MSIFSTATREKVRIIPMTQKYHRFCAVHFKDFERFALHCQRGLFRVSRHLPGTHLNVFHPNFQKSPLLPIAREWRPYANALQTAKNLVRFRGRAVQAMVKGPEEILVAGLRSPTLPEGIYLAVHRGTAINAEIDGLRRRLA